MLVFSVYISFLISRVRPVHSFFEKESILENTSQIFTHLFFHAYQTYSASKFMQFDEGRHTKKTDLGKKSAFWRVNGGARTHDNQNHNLALYQLNYAHHV